MNLAHGLRTLLTCGLLGSPLTAWCAPPATPAGAPASAVPAVATETLPPPLPANLHLAYTLTTGGVTIGTSYRDLTRNPDGSYSHRSHSVPKGLARLFTRVEWFEEGRFEIHAGRVRPLNFLQYRVGADKPHRHGAVFDWTQQTIRYENGSTDPLTAGTQDQGSVVYAMMLDPPKTGENGELMIASGKKRAPNTYRLLRTETLKTSLGPLATRVVQWSTPGNQGDDPRRVTVWLATDRANIPVKLVTTEDGRDAVLTLTSVSGL